MPSQSLKEIDAAPAWPEFPCPVRVPAWVAQNLIEFWAAIPLEQVLATASG
jgi:hypothetical protein